MGKLRGRVSPEKTDAAGLIIDELGQSLVNPLPETPILTEEAIEGTGLIEDGQILVTVFGAPSIGKAWISRGRSSGTDPISHAVGWKAIIIPSQVSLLRCNPLQDPSSIASHATVSLPPIGNPTSIGTDPAGDPLGVSRRFQGRPKGLLAATCASSICGTTSSKWSRIQWRQSFRVSDISPDSVPQRRHLSFGPLMLGIARIISLTQSPYRPHRFRGRGPRS
jgi:hypothetical protein